MDNIIEYHRFVFYVHTSVLGKSVNLNGLVLLSEYIYPQVDSIAAVPPTLLPDLPLRII